MPRRSRERRKRSAPSSARTAALTGAAGSPAAFAAQPDPRSPPPLTPAGFCSETLRRPPCRANQAAAVPPQPTASQLRRALPSSGFQVEGSRRGRDSNPTAGSAGGRATPGSSRTGSSVCRLQAAGEGRPSEFC